MSDSVSPWQRFLLYGFAPLAALLLVAFRLSDSIWYDEALTLLVFATGDPSDALLNYSAPNNHIVFSLLLGMYRILIAGVPYGGVLMRLLPAGCFVLSLLLLTLAVSRLRDRWTGLLATLLLATSHVAINFSAQLRGYSPSFLPVTGALLLVAMHMQKPNWRTVLGYAFCACVAVGTIPTNVIPFAVLSTWIGLVALLRRAWSDRREGIGWLLMMASPALGVIWYLGVLPQLLGHARGYPTGYTVGGVLWHFLASTAGDFLWLLPLFVAGLGGLVCRAWREAETGPDAPRVHLALLASILAVTPVLLSLSGSVPFPRVLVPLLPLWYAALALVAGETLAWLRQRREALFPTVVTALCIVLAGLGYWREVTGAGYRERHTSEDRPQNLYDLYYHHDFHPGRTVRWLDRLARSRPVLILTDTSDLMAISYMVMTLCPEGVGGHEDLLVYYRNAPESLLSRVRAGRLPVVYLTHNPTMATRMAAETNLPPATGGDPLELAHFGFFKVYSLAPIPGVAATPRHE